MLQLHVLVFLPGGPVYDGVILLPHFHLPVQVDDSYDANQFLKYHSCRHPLLVGDYLLAGFAAGAGVAVAFSSLAGLFAGLTSAFFSTFAGAGLASSFLAGACANAVVAAKRAAVNATIDFI